MNPNPRPKESCILDNLFTDDDRVTQLSPAIQAGIRSKEVTMDTAGFSFAKTIPIVPEAYPRQSHIARPNEDRIVIQTGGDWSVACVIDGMSGTVSGPGAVTASMIERRLNSLLESLRKCRSRKILISKISELLHQIDLELNNYNNFVNPKVSTYGAAFSLIYTDRRGAVILSAGDCRVLQVTKTELSQLTSDDTRIVNGRGYLTNYIGSGTLNLKIIEIPFEAGKTYQFLNVSDGVSPYIDIYMLKEIFAKTDSLKMRAIAIVSAAQNLQSKGKFDDKTCIIIEVKVSSKGEEPQPV